MSLVSLSPNDDDIYTTVASFLSSVLPRGTPIVQAQVNRVAEPIQGDFVVMNRVGSPRLATNFDDYVDVYFDGSISGTVLTVTNLVSEGEIEIGSVIFGAGIASNTAVTSFGTGTGGIGTYNVSASQNVSSEKIAAGRFEALQPTDVIVQLDFHGDLSADNSQTVSTLFRDGFAIDQFHSSNASLTPLYSDDPIQIPYINDQNQYEDRWIVKLHLQADQVVTVQNQQYADSGTIQVISVEAAYPVH